MVINDDRVLSQSNVADVAFQKPTHMASVDSKRDTMKLRGYDFYRAIGSPKRIVAPMVCDIMSPCVVSCVYSPPISVILMQCGGKRTGGSIGTCVPHAHAATWSRLVLHADVSQPPLLGKR